jgi:hypothetical protein
MKDKPLIFNIYAILFLLIAISIPVQISVLYGHNFDELGAIYKKLTFFNILVVMASILNFYYCFTASDNVKWSFPLAIGIICFNNSIVLVFGNDFEAYTVILSTLLFMVFSAYFLLTHDTDIINEPKKQWWRIPKRFALKEKVLIEVGNQQIDIGETFDISTSGAFIPITEDNKSKIVPGKVYSFMIGKKHPIKCKAKVIRKTDARGHYPAGIGIQFQDLELGQKYKLQHMLFQTKLGFA